MKKEVEDYFLNPPPGSAAARAVEYGIDLTLTLQNLRLTPEERIRKLDDHLAGPTGLVLAGKDPLAAAKVLGEFAKENQKPSVRIGLVDGKAVNPAYVKRLGELPGREALLGQFAGCLNGVLYQMVGALEALRAQRS